MNVSKIISIITAAIALVTGSSATAAPAPHAVSTSAPSTAATRGPRGEGGGIGTGGWQVVPWKIWPVGDSITRGDSPAPDGGQGGYRAKLDDGRYTPQHEWVGSEVDAQGRRHDGHSGWNFAQVIANVPTWSAGIGGPGAADVVLVHLGTNDDGQNRTGAQMLADAGTLLDLLHQLQPGAVIIIAMIPHVPLNTTLQNAQIDTFNAGLPALAAARTRVKLADHRATEISSDKVHPNAAGYSRMADVWQALLPAGHKVVRR